MMALTWKTREIHNRQGEIRHENEGKNGKQNVTKDTAYAARAEKRSSRQNQQYPYRSNAGA
jgi:hypothetical protein